MNSPEFQPNQSLEHRRQQLFTMGAARLIAHGQIESSRRSGEHVESDSREPLVFTHDVPLTLIAEPLESDKMTVDATVSFTEAHIARDSHPESLPASLLLSVQSIDRSGSLISEEYFIALDTTEDTEEYLGTYLQFSSAGHELVDVLDSRYARDLTEDDLARLDRALSSLPPAPSTEYHLQRS